MKLKKFLEESHANRIALGTNHGGSFLYFGPPDADFITHEFEWYAEDKKRSLIKNYKSLENALFSPLKIEKVKSNDEYTIDSKLMEHAKRISNFNIYIRNTERWITKSMNSFLALDRKVIESYPKVYDDCIAVIIEGEEQGQFMLYEEYVAHLDKISKKGA